MSCFCGTEILGPVCANSGIAESGIRVIDCILFFSSDPQMCYDCYKHDVICFLKSLYRTLIEKYRRNQELNRFEHIFLPQNWHCNLHNHSRSFQFLKFESNWVEDFTEIIRKTLETAREERILSRIRAKFLKVKSNHSTFDSDLARLSRPILYRNRKALKLLKKLYFDDFVLFNYSLGF